MKSALALSLYVLVTNTTAQHDAKPQPVARPFVDPDLKVEVRFDPPKGPGLTYQPVAPAEPAALPALPDAGTGRSRLPADRVLFDPREGELWARGATWKACFSGTGMTFVPFFGSAAPRNFPLAFELRSVRVDGQPIALAAQATVTREGTRVRMDRDGVVEAYELAPTAVEQTFTFTRLPARGDLVVELLVRTELASAAQPVAPTGSAGQRFGSDFGQVAYGAATVQDALGNRAPVTEELAGGVLRLTVPAAFLASAELPITIDPLLTVETPGNGGQAERFADVAYDTLYSRFMVTWEHLYSATDSDVYAQLLDEDGVPIPGSERTIDFSTTSWSRPRIADLAIPHKFLVVAEVGVAPTRQIWGRTQDALFQGNTGAPVQISAGSGGGDKFHCDIGGDPSQSGPTYWLVVWERGLSSTDHDIHGQMVQEDGTLYGPILAIDNSGNSVDTHPTVSKSDGNGPFTSQVWHVMWQHTFSATDEDIWSATVRWDGVIVGPSWPFNISTRNNTNPSVSSVTDDVGGPRAWLAVYQSPLGQLSSALEGVLTRGTIAYPWDLTSIENAPILHNQYQPHVDSDGVRFAVVYSELGAGGNYDTFVSTFHISNQSFGPVPNVSEGHVPLGQSAAMERTPRVCSMRSGGRIGATRYITAWDTVSGSADVVSVAAYNGNAPGPQIVTLPTGCDGLGLFVSGYALLGHDMGFQLNNVGANAPLMMFGRPIAPAMVCAPCGMGIDPTVAIFAGGGQLGFSIPRDASAFSISVAVQGLTVGVGPCLGLVRTSPTAVITVR